MREVRPEPDQLAGSLVGQALGDALGFPVEGYPPAECRAFVLHWLCEDAHQPPGRAGFPFGQYTDDTQLARELARSLVERGSFDPGDYGRRIGELFSTMSVVGRGQATTDAALRLAAGMSWERAGVPSAGNGGAMRAGPIGLAFPNHPDRLVCAARDQCRTTHRDSRASAGAVAVAGAVALALRRGPLDPADFAGRLSEWAACDAGFSEALGRLPGWVALDEDEAVLEIAPLGADPKLSAGWQGISPFVVGSVLWSLYAFLRSPDDYLATIRTAIAVGGDVDTTAAMAGAISGARVGLDGIPSRLARRVNDRGAWGFEALAGLGRELLPLALRA